MSPAEQLLRDHWGHGFLNPDAPAVSALGAGPVPYPGALSGATPEDVTRASDASAERSTASPGPGPGRRSLTTEQYAESGRIQGLIEAHRARTAERERLEHLAGGEM